MKVDLAIIGGGIIGAGVARDAALRGLKVALIEKEDWASGTTSRSTRLIHGGLRYLAHYDFALVKEALTERKRLLRLAPHLVRPLPFILPVYRGAGHPVPMLWSGLLLYDYLQPWRGVPHHRFVPPNVLLDLEPKLRKEGLRGGFLYYDAQCAFPERLCLENVLDAAENGALLLNHHRAVALEQKGAQVVGVRVRDELNGEETSVGAELVLNCGGPWLDDVERLADPKAQPRLRRTKGVHLVVPRFMENAVIFETADAHRVVFLIPWGEHTLIGTTDTDYDGSADDVRAEADDVEYLLQEVHQVLGHAPNRQDILFTTAGLRPLLRQLGRTTAQVSRRHLVVDHEAEDGRRGYATVIGGKITTYRQIAQDVVDFIETKIDRPTRACVTHRRALPGGRLGTSWDAFLESAHEQGSRLGFPQDVVEHLTRHYGVRALQLMQAAQGHPALTKRIQPNDPWVWAEVDFAVTQEGARTLTDVLLRRLSIGLSASQAKTAAPTVARVVGQRLGWDARRTKNEVNAYLATLERNWPVIP